MKIEYDPIADDFFVGMGTLRELYINARKASGKTIGKLQSESGIIHPTLYNLEHPSGKSKKVSNSARALLMGLEVLGYEITIRKVR